MSLGARRGDGCPEDDLVARILQVRPWDSFWYKVTLYFRRYSITIFIASWFAISGIKWKICIVLIFIGYCLDKLIQRNAKDINYPDEYLIREIVGKKILKGYLHYNENQEIMKKVIIFVIALFAIINIIALLLGEEIFNNRWFYSNLDYIFSVRVLENYQSDEPLALYYYMYFSNSILAISIIYFLSIRFPLRDSNILDVTYLYDFHKIPYLSSFGVIKFKFVIVSVYLLVILSIIFLNIIRWNVNIPSMYNLDVLFSTLGFFSICLFSIIYLSYVMKVSAIINEAGIAKA